MGAHWFGKMGGNLTRGRSGSRSLHLELLEARVLLSANPMDIPFSEPEMLTVSEESGLQAPVHPDRVIVGYGTGGAEEIEQVLGALPGATIVQELSSIDAALVDLPDGMSVAEGLKQLKGLEGLSYAEPDYLFEADYLPDDPRFDDLWGLHNTGQTGGTVDADIDAPEAWDIQTGSSDVVVGIIDSGVDLNHPDLSGNLWMNPDEIAGDGLDNDGNGYIDDVNGWDFYEDHNNPDDQHGHGTHVAGTVGAVGDNGVGVTGVNWAVQIAALAVGIDDTGYIDVAAATQAVQYAGDMGFDVVNCSWGGTGGMSQALRDAFVEAGEDGVLFVCAAGNSSSNNDMYPFYPAAYDLDNIISVAATDHNDSLASFSNYGDQSVDLAAPGQQIYSTQMDGGYVTMSGTSMASPHVAGVAALVKAHNSESTYMDLRNALFDGTDYVASLDGYVATGGRLNASGALMEVWTPVAGQDLTVRNLAISPQHLHDVTEVDIDYTVRNFGDTAISEDFNLVFYLSDDNTIDPADDIFLAEQVISEDLEGPDSLSGTVHVTGFPPEDPFMTDGLYFLCSSVDFDDAVSEADETNNLATQNVSWISRTIFEDDFSTDTGWSGYAPDAWERGMAMAGGGESFGNPDPSTDTTPSADDMILGYNIGGDYPNYMSSPDWITSPTVDCSNYEDVTIEFQRWLNVEADMYDQASIEVYDGSGWIQIWNNPSTWLTDNSWMLKTMDVSAYADGNSDFQVRFGMGPTDYSWRFSGWNIDDFKVIGAQDVDYLPPEVQSVSVGAGEVVTQAMSEVQIQFTEQISSATLTDPANYQIVGDAYGDVSIDDVSGGTDAVTLTLNGGDPLPPDQYTLMVMDEIVDLAGNQLDGDTDGDAGGDFTRDFSVKLPGVFAGSYQPAFGGRVTFYDTDYDVENLEVNVRPIATVRGNNAVGITSVTLVPQYTEFGVVIEQAPGSDQPVQIVDQTFASRPISFIAADCGVSLLSLRSEVSGWDLNGLTLGEGINFGEDIDDDGETDDATGVLVDGTVSTMLLRDEVSSDVVIAGSIGKLVAFEDGAILGGELTVEGNLWKLVYFNRLDTAIDVGGNIGSASLLAGSSSAGILDVEGDLNKFYSGAELLGGLQVGGDAGSLAVFDGDIGAEGDDGQGDLVIGGGLGRMLLVNGDMTADQSEPRLQVLGGDMNKLAIVNGDLLGGVSVDGSAGNIVLVGGNFGMDGNSSSISVLGGGMRSLVLTDGDIISADVGDRVEVAGDLGAAIVRGDLAGGIHTSEGGDLGYLFVEGTLGSKIDIDGRLGKGVVLGQIGPEALLKSGAGAGSLFGIGGLAGDVELGGDTGYVQINGELSGNLEVESGRLSVLSIREGALGGGASVSVEGMLHKMIISGGNLDGELSAGSIGVANIVGDGNLSGTVTSGGNIGYLGAGSVSGTVSADSGRIGTISVREDLGGSVRSRAMRQVSVSGNVTDAQLECLGGDLESISVQGSLQNTDISVSGELADVFVRQDYENSNIWADKLKSVRLSGDMVGDGTHEIRAAGGSFSVFRPDARWYITESEDQIYNGVHMFVI